MLASFTSLTFIFLIRILESMDATTGISFRFIFSYTAGGVSTGLIITDVSFSMVASITMVREGLSCRTEVSLD